MFTELEAIIKKGTVRMAITAKNGMLSILVSGEIGEAEMPAIIITDTPKNLDETFNSQLAEALKSSESAFSNIEEYQKLVKAVEEAEKKKKDEKINKKKAAPTKPGTKPTTKPTEEEEEQEEEKDDEDLDEEVETIKEEEKTKANAPVTETQPTLF